MARTSRLLKESDQVLASMPYMDDYDTIVGWPVDDDVACSRYDKAAVFGTEPRSGWSHVGVVCKAKTRLFKAIHEHECVGWAVLGYVVVNLLEVCASLEREDAATHQVRFAAAALRCLNSLNTSVAGTT